MADMTHKKLVIIGAGFSGLGMAIALLKAGEDDFVILEKGSELGGTWRDNTYPGCACDVPSQLYSFSHTPNAHWSHVFARQEELRRYTHDLVKTHNLAPYIRLNSALEHASWSASLGAWEVLAGEQAYQAQYLIAAQGPLHEPRILALPGLERFEGITFHSARWEHEHDLSQRRVAVIGTGSSAIQFVPELVDKVRSLHVFQRTPAWVLPKPDHPIGPLEQAAFAHLPGFQRAYRGTIYGITELLQWAQRRPHRMVHLERLATWHLERQITDEALRAKLRPQFALGCKRLLLSNTWYPALSHPHTTLVDAAVTAVEPDAILDAKGGRHEVDAIIFGTGFHVSDASVPSLIYGAQGDSLAQRWAGSPQAYLGTTVHGFPNLFMMIGPNMGNGHGSALVIIESQARYIIDALRFAKRAKVRSLMPREDAQASWNARVQRALEPTVWNAGGCNSWYIDSNGVNSAIYPWSTFDLRARQRRFDAASFELEPSRDVPQELDGVVVAITGGAHGIGLATAKLCAARGARVAIGDIDLEAAKQAASAIGALALELDVCSRPSFEAFIHEVEAHHGPIELFINNAGVLPTGSFVDEPDEVTLATFKVNTLGPALGMKLILPRMIARGRGHVVNVASLAGKLALPYMATYAASKHAVVGLTASARQELEGTGVSISAILPTAVHTRLAAGVPLDGLFTQQPEDVARVILKSYKTRAASLTVPEHLGLIVPLYGVLPQALRDLISTLFDAKRLMGAAVRQARQGYEASIVDQESQGAGLGQDLSQPLEASA